MKLRRIFPAVYFVNKNIPKERAHANLPKEKVQVLLFEKNLMNFQVTVQTFLRNLILMAIWKDQVQHSAIKITAFSRIFVLQNFIHITHLKTNQVRPVSIRGMI